MWVGLLQSVEDLERRKTVLGKREFSQQMAFRLKLQHQLPPVCPPCREMCRTMKVLITWLNDLWRHKYPPDSPNMYACKFKLFAYVYLSWVAITWNIELETGIVHSILLEIDNKILTSLRYKVKLLHSQQGCCQSLLWAVKQLIKPSLAVFWNSDG